MCSVITICVIVALIQSAQPTEKQLVGNWRWLGGAEGGEVRFARDHTFAITTRTSATPGVIRERGRWRIKDDKLVLKFRSRHYRKLGEKHIIIRILHAEYDRFTMQKDGKATFTLQRLD